MASFDENFSEINPAEIQTAASDQPSRSIRCGDFSIEGFSRAAVQTFWRVPEFKLGFDLGWQPWEYMGTPRWFLSHTHMDHMLALPAYVARRRMMKMPPPDLYLPAAKVEEAQRLLAIFCRLDQGKLPCRFIGLEDGDEVPLSRELVVTASKTFHTVPSLGYIVWERRNKLKEEFLTLSGEQIRDLRLSGVEITREIRTPRVAYLGDSTAEGLDRNPDMYRADVLIAEMTFVAPDHHRSEIRKFGHMHLDDFLARRDRFENKLVIAAHFSTRYFDREIVRTVQRACPDMFDGRLKLWL